MKKKWAVLLIILFVMVVMISLSFVIIQKNSSTKEGITKKDLQTNIDKHQGDNNLQWFPRPHKYPLKNGQNGDSVYIDKVNGWEMIKREDENVDNKEDNVDVYQTMNGGSNWIIVSSTSNDKDKVEFSNNIPSGAIPSRGSKIKISFLDLKTGWISGASSKEGQIWLYITKDSGYSWKLQNLEIPALCKNLFASIAHPITFFNKNDGIFIVDFSKEELKYRYIYFTHDGGKTWVDPSRIDAYSNIKSGASGSIKWDFVYGQNTSISLGEITWSTIDFENWEQKYHLSR